jgi:anti-sigma factor RsiW
MTHPSEETLNDYIERELSPAEHVQVATHLDTCRDCALVVAELQQILRDASALGPYAAPHVWAQFRRGPGSHRAQSQSQRPKLKPGRSARALATAALVVMALRTLRVLANSSAHRSRPVLRRRSAGARGRRSDGAGTGAHAVGDHLERSQMVLVELAHADTSGELDISAERQLADDLVASNRLYRQTAQQMGHANVAGLLDELERVLWKSRVDRRRCREQLADIQQLSSRRASCSR